MSFVEDDGNVVEVEAEHGKNLLEVAHDNDVDLEGEKKKKKMQTVVRSTYGGERKPWHNFVVTRLMTGASVKRESTIGRQESETERAIPNKHNV